MFAFVSDRLKKEAQLFWQVVASITISQLIKLANNLRNKIISDHVEDHGQIVKTEILNYAGCLSAVNGLNEKLP